ncbi:hypothetical protein ACA910_004204 [Epithemia clementina (nom. ined.)]
MRLYNPQSRTPTATAVFGGGGIQHFNQRQQQQQQEEVASSTTTKPSNSWRSFASNKPATTTIKSSTRAQQKQQQLQPSNSNSTINTNGSKGNKNKTLSSLRLSALNRPLQHQRQRSPNRTNKLQAIWPPPAPTNSSMSLDSAGVDVVPVPTSSTASTSSETQHLDPLQKSSLRCGTIKAEQEAALLETSPTWQEDEKKEGEEHTTTSTHETTSKEAKDEGVSEEDTRPVKMLQRKFTSAFQSPLRLAKLQFRSSPGHRLLQRFQAGGGAAATPAAKKEQGQADIKATLLQSANRSSNEGYLPDHDPTTLECDPVFSTDDEEQGNDNNDGEQDFPVPAPTKIVPDRTSMHTFQSPLKKFHLLQKQLQQLNPLNSPQLSKNETNTTATSETYDGLPGRVSSESFHFDIELVKSTDEAAAAAAAGTQVRSGVVMQRARQLRAMRPYKANPRGRGIEQLSVVSKSSSSTLTSHWYDEHCDEQELNFDHALGLENNKRFPTSSVNLLDRPMAPAPWASVEGFVMRSEDNEFVVHPTTTTTANDSKPAPIHVQRRRVSSETYHNKNHHPSLSEFEVSWSGDTWSDGDSWIDFTADPFKTVQTMGVSKPSASKALDDSSNPAAVMSSLFEQEPTLDRDLLFAPLRETCLSDPFAFSDSGDVMTTSWTPIVKTQNTHCSSPGNKQPSNDKAMAHPLNDTKGRGPTLLGPLLQSRYQMVRQQQTKQLVNQTPAAKHAESTPEEKTPISGSESKEFRSDLPEKYAKMLKMGLPEGAVRNAMLRDGADTDALDNTGVSPKPTRPSSSPGDTKPTLDPYRRFRVHWEPHDNVRSNTVWAMVHREKAWISEKIGKDHEEYNKLFQEAKDPLLKRAIKKEVNSFGLTGTVIDAKRANNGGIVLARIKLSNHELARAIDGFDYDVLSADQIRALLPLLPTAEEEEKLRSSIAKAGGKHMLKSECEKFMASMLGIRHAKQKLDAMLFMKQFNVVIDGLKSDSRLLQKACDEVMSSSRLRRLLGVLLEIGNRLNTAGQSRKTKAAAIRLQSLSRLSQGKAFDRKTTFLQYVARVLHRNDPESVQLRDELQTLRCAEKVDLDQMKDDLAELESRIAGIRQMALRIGGDALSSEVEVDLLQSTSIGRFTLDACLKMESVYHEMDAVQQSYSALLHYFGEEQPEGEPTPDVFRILSVFCNQWESAVENSITQDRAARRGMNRNPKGRRVSYTNSSFNCPRRSSAEPRSGIGSVLDAIRCKAFNPAAIDL